MASDTSDPFLFGTIRFFHSASPQQYPREFESAQLAPISSQVSLASSPSRHPGRARITRSRRPSSSNRRSRNAYRHHYLRPGDLAQLRDARRSARILALQSSFFSKKRRLERSASDENGAAAEDSREARRGDADTPADVLPDSEMTPGRTFRVFGPLCPQRKKLLAPKCRLTESNAPQTSPSEMPVNLSPQPSDVSTEKSLLESLPIDLLVRIVCHLQHDQLKPAFHVSRKLRQAILIARECHFDYTTPDREQRNSTQYLVTPGAIRTHSGTGGPSRLPSPMAPKPAHKSLRERISLAEMKQLAVPLFRGSSSRVRRSKPPSLTRTALRAVASHRVLFYEEELCQAVAQNSI